MGQTGSGKSLFAKCLCGLIRPDSGKIFLDGQNITTKEPRFRRIGYVPQDCGLFPNMNVESVGLYAEKVGYSISYLETIQALGIAAIVAITFILGLRFFAMLPTQALIEDEAIQ